jgi:outer membrane protein, heavy metal efflux system
VTLSGRLPGLLIVVAIMATSHRLGAENVPTPEVAAGATALALDQALDEALRANAQLQAMRAKWSAMKERPAQARALASPMLKYGGMDMVDGGDFPNTNEKRFMVEQSFPWSGKRDLRGKIAEQDAAVMQHEVDNMAREVVMMVRENYYDLYAVQRVLTITAAEEEVLKRMAQIATTKYATGAVSQQDVLKAQSELTMLQQHLLDLQAQEATLTAKLNTLLNRPVDAPLGRTVTPPAAPAPVNRDQLFAAAATNRPEIQGATAQIERSRLERELMAKEFYSDYALGVEYRSLREGEDMVMFTVGVELPVWRGKYGAGVREAAQMIAANTAAKEATLREVSREVQDARFKLDTARRTLDLYQKTLVPQAQLRFSASEAGYRTGRVDFMDLLESERFFLNARVMAAMAEGNLGMQAARLERAIGADWEPAAGHGGEPK